MQRIPFSKDNADHVVIMKVCDFVCGVQNPPAPEPKDYMETSLAAAMAEYQDQMKEEARNAAPAMRRCLAVCCVQIVAACDGMVNPVVRAPAFSRTRASVHRCALQTAMVWELDMMHPSSEDLELKVFEILVSPTRGEVPVSAAVHCAVLSQALIIDPATSTACMADLNVYVLGTHSSGFTLDAVEQIEMDVSTIPVAAPPLPANGSRRGARLATMSTVCALAERDEGAHGICHDEGCRMSVPAPRGLPRMQSFGPVRVLILDKRVLQMVSVVLTMHRRRR